MSRLGRTPPMNDVAGQRFVTFLYVNSRPGPISAGRGAWPPRLAGPTEPQGVTRAFASTLVRGSSPAGRPRISCYRPLWLIDTGIDRPLSASGTNAARPTKCEIRTVSSPLAQSPESVSRKCSRCSVEQDYGLNARPLRAEHAWRPTDRCPCETCPSRNAAA